MLSYLSIDNCLVSIIFFLSDLALFIRFLKFKIIVQDL